MVSRLLGPPAAVATRLLTPAVPVLMLHRFAAEEPDDGLPVATFRALLERALRQGVKFVRLRDVIDDALAGRPLARGTACLTVDDGYRDFLDVAVPLLTDLGVPATVFVVSEFVEGRCWMWWDQVAHAIALRDTGSVTLETPTGSKVLSWASRSEQAPAVQRATRWLKTLPDSERRAAVVHLAEYTGLDLAVTPSSCASMDWSGVRSCAAKGMDVGPHTRTHPILSQTEDAEAAREIGESWRTLRDALPDAVPVFAFPNGTPDDFGEREIRLVREAGLTAALSSIPGYISTATFARDRYALPRYAFELSSARLLQVVSGVERIKSLWR